MATLYVSFPTEHRAARLGKLLTENSIVFVMYAPKVLQVDLTEIQLVKVIKRRVKAFFKNSVTTNPPT